MASQFQHVRPGDIISSDLINQIIDKLKELEQKIGTGGGTTTGPQVITGSDPESQQAAGQTLTLFGNFDFPLAQNTVSIDQTPIATSDFLPGSSSTQLSFHIPTSLAPVGGTGSRPVTIHVKRANGQEGQRSYTILPQAQSAVPDPFITPSTAQAPNPVNLTDPNAKGMLKTKQKALLVGLNLSPNPTLVLKVQTGPSAFIIYPDATANPPRLAPTIDPANSNNSQIVFTVPDISEFTPGVSGTMILEVSIPGAINKATTSASVMRI
ncbi:MAG TPA: hypothetical protein VE713_01890 [Pyrinomonadaceae bacterium]|nr:hypothetical protein [Pyrinomonadaceae bacterium]